MTKKWNIALLIAAASIGVSTRADQTPQLSRVMHDKLTHSQAILEAVVTSNWTMLDRESRALAMATRDPAWRVLVSPEYIRFSDNFQSSLQDLIEASAKMDLDAAAEADVALTRSCVQCHSYLARQRR